jgi:hypothetical protein
MYSKLEGDLASSVNRLGDSDTLKDYVRLIDEYKNFKQGFDGQGSGARFINSLVRGRIGPEAIGHMLNNSTLKTRAALNAGGVDAATGIPMAKKVSATDTLLSSKAPNSDELSLNKFLKYSDREGFKKMAETPNYEPQTTGSELGDILQGFDSDIVSKRAMQNNKVPNSNNNVEIDELRNITKELIKKDSYKNNSKTAQYNMINALKLMSGFELAKYILKDVGLSVAYKSKLFNDWVRKGVITPAEYKMLRAKSGGSRDAARNTAINTLLNTDRD